MTEANIRRVLSEYGEDHVVMDINCLFVASTLREEIWLYRGREDNGLLEAIRREASLFSIREVDPDRGLFAFSGGEQALIAVLTVLMVIEKSNFRDVKLLLCGVLESLSTDNRHLLIQRLEASALHGWIRAYTLREDHIVSL
jgi:hypothetical protein